MTDHGVLPVLDLQGQLNGISVRLIDIAGNVASEAEDAAIVIRSLTDQVEHMTLLAARLEEAASAMEQEAQQQAHALATARISLTTNTPVIAALEQSVASVAAINTTISAIARESRILSLNARIEAARAGSAGNAFAVVATEMATLTERTKRATDEIDHRAAIITQDVGSANAIVAAHTKLVLQQNETLTASVKGSTEQRKTAAELANITAATSATVNRAASAIGRVGANATAVKVLAKQLSKLGQKSRDT